MADVAVLVLIVVADSPTIIRRLAKRVTCPGHVACFLVLVERVSWLLALAVKSSLNVNACVFTAPVICQTFIDIIAPSN